MLDARLGVLALAGGLFLMFPVFNTLNAETVSVDYTPPEIDPPDNLPPIDPPPFQPPPDAMPPCMDQDVQLQKAQWTSTGFPSTGTPYQDSYEHSVPPPARALLLDFKLQSFVGRLDIKLIDPNGTVKWEYSKDHSSAFGFLGAGGVNYDDQPVIPLYPGTWTLTWDNLVQSGSASLEGTIQIRCEDPGSAAAPDEQQQTEGGRRAGP